MLNPFPQLLVFSFFAPTVLRIAAACVFFYLAYSHFGNRSAAAKELAFLTHKVARAVMGLYILVEALAGLSLLLGYWTQIGALVGLVISLKILLIRRSFHHLAPLSRLAYVLLAVICFSLALSGAGAVAFDLPL